MGAEDRDNLVQRRTILRRRLEILINQRAHFGIYVPDYIVLEIQDLQAQLTEIAKALGEPLAASEASLINQAVRHDFYAHILAPVGYVSRAELLFQIRTLLVAAPFNNRKIPAILPPRVLVLHGMGGVGKSVVARALCDEPDIQATFSDGILWATVGQKPDVAMALRSWVQALGGIVADLTPSIESLRGNLANLLRARACLLIVDDIWKRTDAEQFLVGGPLCQHLVTTRDAAIGETLGAAILHIPVMTEDEANALLDAWAGDRVATVEAAVKKQVVARLGALPLALKLAGAQLRYKDLADWLATFDVRRLADRRPETIHDSLEATFKLSLDILPTDSRRLYAALAIFKEHEAFAEIGVVNLWMGMASLRPEETSELLDDLATRALLEVRGTEKQRVIVLHDLLRDLIATELGEQGRVRAHSALLNSYREKLRGQGWHTIPYDSYIFNHLAYHLAEIGAYAELSALFSTQQWMIARFEQDDYTYDGYLDDLAYAWKLADAFADRQLDAGADPASIVDCFRYALIRSSIQTLSATYSPKLVARAVQLGIWTARRAVSLAGRVPNLRQRISMCIALLVSNGLTAEEEEIILHIVFETANQLSERSPLVELLVSIGVQRPHPQWAELVAQIPIVCTSEEQQWCSDLLTWLITRMEGQLLVDTLSAAATMNDQVALVTGLARRKPADILAAATLLKDEAARAEVLAALAPMLEEPLLADALEAARPIRDKKRQAKVLTALASRLREPQQTEALARGLAAARAIRSKAEKSAAVAALAPLLSGELLADALASATGEKDGRVRIKMLAALAPQLSETQRNEVVTQVREAIAPWDHQERVEVLSSLARRLPEPQRTQIVSQALAAVAEIRYAWQRAAALEVMVARLEGSLVTAALAIARDIQDDSSRAEALATLAPQLEGSQIAEVYSLVGTFPAKFDRAKVLLALAPRLSGSDQSEAVTQAVALLAARSFEDSGESIIEFIWPTSLDSVTEKAMLARVLVKGNVIRDEENWIGTLQVLVPKLPEPQRQKMQKLILDEVITVENIGLWAQDLASIVSALPEALQTEALAHALAISGKVEDEQVQVQVLAALAPQLAEPQRAEVLARLLAAVRTTKDKRNLIDVLAKLAPQLAEPQRAEVLARLLAAIPTIEDQRDRTEALAKVVPQLPVPRRSEQLARLLAEVKTLDLDWVRADLLITLFPLLPEPQRTEIRERALAEAEKIEGQWTRSRYFLRLAAQLPEPRRTDLLERALATADAIEHKWTRLEALTELVPYLTGAQLAKTLAAVHTIGYTKPWQIANVWKCETLTQAQRRQVRHTLPALMHELALEKRHEVLGFCYFLSDAPTLLSVDILSRFADQIVEICHEWQWL